MPDGAQKSARRHIAASQDDRRALVCLVDKLDDAHDGTYSVYAREFLGVLRADHFDYVGDRLESDWRDSGVGQDKNEAIETEAGFVYRALQDLVLGYDGLPERYERHHAA